MKDNRGTKVARRDANNIIVTDVTYEEDENGYLVPVYKDIETIEDDIDSIVDIKIACFGA